MKSVRSRKRRSQEENRMSDTSNTSSNDTDEPLYSELNLIDLYDNDNVERTPSNGEPEGGDGQREVKENVVPSPVQPQHLDSYEEMDKIVESAGDIHASSDQGDNLGKITILLRERQLRLCVKFRST